VFSQGLAKNTSLQHLSLRHCPIGDDGCEILCRTVMDRPNLITLALIDCQLTAKGAFHVSKLIKAQELVRFDESWKHTLRYQSVDHSLLPGLRRITLNGNPSIGDKGLAHIVDVVVDDLWMKGRQNSLALYILFDFARMFFYFDERNKEISIVG
ncbi:hypothetical protein AAG570_005263, partial [Ranatra chinensis]